MLSFVWRNQPPPGSGAARRWRKIASAAVITLGVGARGTAAAPTGEEAADLKALKAVCGACHTIDMFANAPRSQDAWFQVYQKMSQLGLKGTNEQLNRVVRYVAEKLTVVNINTSPADEIAPVIGVSDEVAEDIVTRRERQKFMDISELQQVPGVDAKILEERKARILF